jgi:hypothetical protein
MRIFSIATLEFSTVMRGDSPKKAHFRPKIHKRTFSAVTMDFGTFSTLMMDFSTVEMGILGSFVLILFYSYGGNRKGCWDFHRNCRKISLSIVTVEKVRREEQQRGLFQRKCPLQLRKNPS